MINNCSNFQLIGDGNIVAIIVDDIAYVLEGSCLAAFDFEVDQSFKEKNEDRRSYD